MKTEKLPLAVMAVALVGVMSASAQSTLTVNSITPGETVNVQVADAFTDGPRDFSAGINNLTVDGVPTTAFCVDLFRHFSFGQTFTDYTYTDLASAPLAPAGPMGAMAASDISKL